MRAALWSVVFLVVGTALMELLGYPNLPARGASAARLDQFLIVTVVPMFLLLLFLVADFNRLCARFNEFLKLDWEWPEPTQHKVLPTLAKPNADDSIRRRTVSAWIKIQILAARTQAISPLVFLPLTVLVLLVVARSALFDGWGMPTGLVFVLATTFAICCLTAWLLHRTAEQARTQSLQQLRACLFERETRDPDEQPTAQQIKSLIERIETLREGAFVPIWERPVVVAGVLPLLGIGGLQLAQALGLVPGW
jgi:hypothetical protein